MRRAGYDFSRRVNTELSVVQMPKEVQYSKGRLGGEGCATASLVSTDAECPYNLALCNAVLLGALNHYLDLL